MRTAGSTEKCNACVRSPWRAVAIDYRSQDFVAVVREQTAGSPWTILDIIGGDYLQRNLDALAMSGRLVQTSGLPSARARRST